MLNPTKSYIRQAIERESHRLGFELFGVTSPDPPQNYTIFDNWLAAGRHAEMAYLASERSRQRRSDPRQILPECQSILVFGIRHKAPERLDEGGGQGEKRLIGKTAAYAWGEDYHDVIPERLARIGAFIENLAGRPVAQRIYTDSGPLLERELAQRAGFGWIGRNSCLIHPYLGSFFLLGEILLDLELEADQPLSLDYCGSCRRCLDACPTGCILPDRTIDAGRCISYLTIELKGSIPDALRPKIGDRVFGCDICQQACPWNRRPNVSSGDVAFSTRLETARPDLLTQLSLSVSDFNRSTKGSPLQRAKRRGYLRNVAAALGCTRDELAVPALEKALVDPDTLVRSHSAWALGQIAGPKAEKALGDVLPFENDPQVLDELKRAYQRCQDQNRIGNRTESR